MKNEHERFWNKERLAQATAIGMTPEEVSTLASIVEEETNNNEEKPMVAGLYINFPPIYLCPKGMYFVWDKKEGEVYFAASSPY